MLRTLRPALLALCLTAPLAHAAADDFQFASRPIAMQKKPGALWTEQPTRLLTATPEQSDAINQYGGSLDWPAEAANGFFRTQKIDGRWWLIDPEGRRFIQAGVAAVTPFGNSPTAKAALTAQFGDTAGWAQATSTWLREHGFNGAGAWSNSVFAKAEYRMPHARIVNFMGDYGKQRGGVFQKPGHLGYPENAIFVFDPEFPAFAEQYAQALAKEAANPWLIGWFSDNEMPLYNKTLDGFLRLPAEDHGGREARRWLAERQRRDSPDIGAISQEDRLAFVGHVYSTYLRIVSGAIRRADPNHLYLGSRLHSDEMTNPHVWQAAGQYIDVVSVNFYRDWAPASSLLKNWEVWSGKPAMITEWYTKGEDSGLPNTTGAGWVVKTQADRGDHYQNFTLALLESANIVGWHFFKYQDNDPAALNPEPSNIDANKGLVNVRYQPYAELVQRARRVNQHKYGLIRHFTQRVTPGQAGTPPSGALASPGQAVNPL